MIQTLNIPKTREAAIEWAQRIVLNGRTVFLDTETTGLGKDAEICDIGIVALDGTVLLDRLVKPRRPIPLVASNIHGITNEMVEDAEPWHKVYWPAFEAIVGTNVVVYNLQYDLGILNQVSNAEAMLNFDSDPEIPWHCAMLAYSGFDGTPGKWGDLKWHKLDAACGRFGITPGGHRALADADATRRLVIAMAGMVEAATA